MFKIRYIVMMLVWLRTLPMMEHPSPLRLTVCQTLLRHHLACRQQRPKNSIFSSNKAQHSSSRQEAVVAARTKRDPALTGQCRFRLTSAGDQSITLRILVNARICSASQKAEGCEAGHSIQGELTSMYVYCCSLTSIFFQKEMPIGDHASPQDGFGLSKPREAEGGGGNTGRGRKRERAQETAQQASSKHAFASRHGSISNGSPNQKDIAGKNRAHSSKNRVGTSGQEAERIQEPRHAKAADICRVRSQHAAPCAPARQ
jgi:hypothetical protein